MRFYKKSLLLFFFYNLFLFLSLLSLNFGVNAFAFQRETRVNDLNLVLADLAYEQISLEAFNSQNPLTLPTRIKWYISINKELAQYGKYYEEKNAIKGIFRTKVTNYVSQIAKYSEVDFTFLPTELETIDFQIQRDSEKYINSLKVLFRQAISTYNSTAKKPLRWELDKSEMENMSNEEKLGQFIMVSLRTYTLTDSEKSLIANNHVGGVLLYKQNVWDEKQVASLTESIQQLSPKYPVFIAVDQEGGLVKRIAWDDTLSQKQIATLNETEQCNQFSRRSQLLSSLGINWNLGIVADVSVSKNSFIYSRTFSGDYDAASTISARAVNCSREVLTTLKHYPGHGATMVDTHSGLGLMQVRSESEWLTKDAKPFVVAKNADSIMTGHLIMPWLDNKYPATLSKTHIAYLRNNIGYSGVIVTDDIRMLESAGYTLSDAFTQAILAGNDVVLASIVDDRRNDFLPLIKKLHTTGQLTDEEIDTRISRIIKVKNKIIHSQERYVPAELVYPE